MSIVISFLDPFEALQVEGVEKFLQEMVRRGWKEKKTYKSIKHLTTVHRYDLSDKEYSVTAWKTVHGGPSCSGYLFCLGGERDTPSNQNATYSFLDNPSAQLIDNDDILGNDGFPRDWSAVAATIDAHGRIRTVGGFNGRNSVAQCLVYPSESERRRDTQQKNQWKPSGQLPSPCCFASACTTSDGHVVVTGGGSSLFQGAAVSGHTFLQQNTGAESTRALTWQKVASMQHLRCGHSSAVLPSGKVVVTGGYAGGMDYLTSTEMYDSALDRWMVQPRASMHCARSGFGFGLSSNGAVYAFGGSSNGSDGHDSVEMYDERVGRWELLPQKTRSGRGYLGGCVGGSSGCLYAAGGVR